MVEFCGKCDKTYTPNNLSTCIPIKNQEPEILTLEETQKLEVLTLDETKELEVLSLDETKELEILSLDETKELEILSFNDDIKETEFLSLEKQSQLKNVAPTKKNNKIEKQDNINNQASEVQPMQTKKKISFFKQCLNIIINYIKGPVETIENNINLCKISHALVMLIINSIIFGLFATILLEDVLDELYGIILSLSNYINFNEKITLIEIPYVKCILIFSVLCIIFIGLTSFITTIIINKVIKLKTSITKVIKLYAITSLTATTTFTICCISSLLNTHITPIILFIGLFLNQYYINVTMPSICYDKNKNKLGYAIVISPILVISAIFLLLISLI